MSVEQRWMDLQETMMRMENRRVEDERRRAREANRRAVASAVGAVASALAAVYVFHPDAAEAGRGFARWSCVAMMAPLLATGAIEIGDLVPEGSE